MNTRKSGLFIFLLIMMAMMIILAIPGCSGGGSGNSSPFSAIPSGGGGGGEQPPSGPPQITSLSPNNGQVGSSVQINGNRFSSTQGSVSFNGTAATEISSWNNNLVVAKVPNGASSGNVTVSNTQGTSNGMAFTVNAPAGNPPQIASLNPTGGNIGTQTIITGTDLNGVTSVTFNGTTAVTFNVDSPTQITATVPAGASTGPVVVTHPANGASNGVTFTVTNPPTITGLNPPSGTVGSQVVITGTNFNGTSVTFNGTASSFVVDSPTQITATVPAGATSGNVVVTTSAGSSNGVNFVVLISYTYNTQRGSLSANTYIRFNPNQILHLADTVNVKQFDTNLNPTGTINDPSGGDGVISVALKATDVYIACGTRDIYKNGVLLVSTTDPIVDLDGTYGSNLAVLTRNGTQGWVTIYNSSGGVVNASWQITGANSPLGIAYTSDSNNIWIADWNNNRLVRCTPSGGGQTAFGSFGSNNSQFDHPKSLAIGSDGKIYVADAGNYRFQVFDSQFGYLGKYTGSNGSANGQFLDMDGIAVDSSGNVYVSDFGNRRIQKFIRN